MGLSQIAIRARCLLSADDRNQDPPPDPDEVSVNELSTLRRQVAELQARLAECDRYGSESRIEQRFRALIEAAPIPMLLSELDSGRILMANKLTEPIYGLTLDQVHHANARDLYFNDEDRNEIVRQISEKGYIRGIELWGRRADGSGIPFILSSQRVDYGGIDALLTGFNDLTELRETQKTLSEHEEELAYVMRRSMMGEMAAGLAHELNQPLAAISNYAAAVLNDLDAERPDLERLREALRRIADQSNRAGGIIRHLRRLVTKRRSGVGPVCGNDMVRRAIDLTRSEAADAKVKLSARLCDDASTTFRADQIQIEQVLINLIRNGIEALADKDGDNRRVVVATDGSDPDRILFTVSDNGPVIGVDALVSIFDPFFTTKPDGMGMGLAISKSVASAHQGTLTVQPNPEGGVTFRLKLPVAEEALDRAAGI